MTDPLLVVSPDPEKALTDYLVGLSAIGGPLVGWSAGTRTPENETPTSYIQVRQIDGDSPNPLMYRHTMQIRVWHTSEHTAKRYANLVLAYVRRDLGARAVTLPVPLPDRVDPGRNFFQCSALFPQIGVNA